jgi:hypothetical protein
MSLKWDVHSHNGLRTFNSGAYQIIESHEGEEKVYNCFHYGSQINIKPRYTIELAKELCDIHNGML